MMAAAATHAPVQAPAQHALPGVGAPAGADAAESLLRAAGSVRVTGVLTEDARIYSTAGATPHSLLVLQMRQHEGLPYEARVDCGTTAAERLAAEAKLPLLKRGSVCIVWARSIQPRTDHGLAVLLLRGVTMVQPYDQPAARGEQEHAS